MVQTGCWHSARIIMTLYLQRSMGVGPQGRSLQQRLGSNVKDRLTLARGRGRGMFRGRGQMRGQYRGGFIQRGQGAFRGQGESNDHLYFIENIYKHDQRYKSFFPTFY